jgi:hypothetical protein
MSKTRRVKKRIVRKSRPGQTNNSLTADTAVAALHRALEQGPASAMVALWEKLGSQPPPASPKNALEMLHSIVRGRAAQRRFEEIVEVVNHPAVAELRHSEQHSIQEAHRIEDLHTRGARKGRGVRTDRGAERIKRMTELIAEGILREPRKILNALKEKWPAVVTMKNNKVVSLKTIRNELSRL